MRARKALNSVVVAVAAVLIVGLLIGGGWLLRRNFHGPGMMMGYGFPLGMHTFGGGILMLLFWGAIIVSVALLVIGLGRPDVAPASRDETPLGILKRRYASGEIDHDELEQIKESLLR